MYKMIKYEWERIYFIEKVMDILKKPEPDIWRFQILKEYIQKKHLNFKNKIKFCYKKCNSIKFYFFKNKKFLIIEKEEFSI